MKVILKKAINVGKVLKSENDKIHFGDKIQQERKNYYIIKNPIFYRNNLFVFENNEKKLLNNLIYLCLIFFKINIINIKSPFPLRRRQLLKLGFLDLLKIRKIKTLKLKRVAYLFVMNKPHSNNYWHSLIDNFSDLINILLNYKNIDILCNLDGFSELNKKYFFFLKQIFNFNYINIKKKNFLFNGNILMTDTGVKHELSLEFKKELAKKFNTRAFVEAKKNFQADKIENVYKIDKYGYHYGIVPHSYKLFINKGERVIKNYSIPYTSPYRYSIFSSFKKLKKHLILSKIKYEKIFIERKIQNNKKFLSNINEIRAILSKFNFNFISFEDLSFKEQIEVMNSCKILVGLHGSGFTNMVFMNSGSSVIDILPLSYSMPQTKEVEVIANIVDVNYYKISAKDVSNSQNIFEANEQTLSNLIKTLI